MAESPSKAAGEPLREGTAARSPSKAADGPFREGTWWVPLKGRGRAAPRGDRCRIPLEGRGRVAWLVCSYLAMVASRPELLVSWIATGGRMLPRFCARFVSAAWAQAEREATAALVDLAQAAVGEFGAGIPADSAALA